MARGNRPGFKWPPALASCLLKTPGLQAVPAFLPTNACPSPTYKRYLYAI
jgi:hypothetical protein